MPRHHSTTTLSKIIDALRTEWYKITDRKGEIEETFKIIGIDFEYDPARRGRPSRPKGKTAPKAKKGRRQKRGQYSETAEQFVLGLLKGKKLTTAEVNAAWKKAGRGGVANNSLTKLTKAKKIVRHSVKGSRGGTYSVA